MIDKRVGKPSQLLPVSHSWFYLAKFLLVLSSLIPEGKKSQASLHLLDIHEESIGKQQLVLQ